MRRLRQQLSYANVMATIAVFVALGGSSYAVATGSIGSRQLKNNAVASADLKNNDIRSKDVRNGSLTGSDVRESTLQTVPSADTAGRANSADIANRADLATNIVAPEGFHEVGTPGEPAFRAGCAKNGEFPQLQSVGFYRDREGVVHLKGSYTCANAGVPAFALPPGYRPPAGVIHAQAVGCLQDPPSEDCGDSLTTQINVAGTGFGPRGEGDGVVAAAAKTVILSGVSFRAGS
jgi:hypothetical protein